MIDLSEVQTYLVISKRNFIIYLFDKKKLKTLYFQKLDLENEINNLDLYNLNDFLNENIFKIEKLIGHFLKNIFIFLESENIFNINFSVKKKNYEKKLHLSNLENLLVEAKHLIQENYNNYKILHILINRYMINGTSYVNFNSDLDSDNFCLELNFKCLHENMIMQITNILDQYHIEIDRFLDLKYTHDLFLFKDIDPAQKYFKVLNNFNENEVNLISKNVKKLGFFEKFFQIFS